MEKLSEEYAFFISLDGKIPLNESHLEAHAWLAAFGVRRLIAHIRLSSPNVEGQPRGDCGRAVFSDDMA